MPNIINLGLFGLLGLYYPCGLKFKDYSTRPYVHKLGYNVDFIGKLKIKK